MSDNNEFDLEDNFGLLSQGMIWGLHAICVRAGSKWDLDKPETMEIIVTKENADSIYDWCRAIRSGYDVGLDKRGMAKIKEARRIAHEFLYDEANDPSTPIERKIALVRLTSK